MRCRMSVRRPRPPPRCCLACWGSGRRRRRRRGAWRRRCAASSESSPWRATGRRQASWRTSRGMPRGSSPPSAPAAPAAATLSRGHRQRPAASATCGRWRRRSRPSRRWVDASRSSRPQTAPSASTPTHPPWMRSVPRSWRERSASGWRRSCGLKWSGAGSCGRAAVRPSSGPRASSRRGAPEATRCGGAWTSAGSRPRS
mmetsp:Transcript_98633/g.283489  ORF Transcript_98633/g.283489 Transcript_98633/m.283489 type:complete len:200 (+) Transcript_98633:270-869(+)